MLWKCQESGPAAALQIFQSDERINLEHLNSSIYLCPCGFCGNRSLYRGVRSVSDCQICWFLFDQSLLRRLKVMLLSCVNHTEQTSNEIFYLFGCSSIMYLFSNDRHMGDNA